MGGNRVIDRRESKGFELIDSWDSGFGWFAHPDESAMRASHAFAFDNGVWIVDPLDSPGIHDRIAELGEVVGVAICSSWHTRDANHFAERYDVPIYIPAGMPNVGAQVTGTVERYADDLPDADVRIFHRQLVPGFGEAILYHDSGRTLYIPDTLGTAPYYLVGEERLGAPLLARLNPPRSLLSLNPARICVGHGRGIFEDPTPALQDAIVNGRRRMPRALFENFGTGIRIAYATLRR
ncbi:hypothetical protein [Halopiger aswanensis]|uniref:Glyoxylase-like metal-dependent hydrolase (Beta-lactamase superfamily II) n=1 Tax=Halopiger aswanensis TaxID=148449 RepID=A0A3R7GTQ3_9EURY|nr:hypothetical protein [Halopiger aswanensis]RKD89210.1 hypothetical protein ATJ93_4038 [Halopiger aswanensis]